MASKKARRSDRALQSDRGPQPDRGPRSGKARPGQGDPLKPGQAGGSPVPAPPLSRLYAYVIDWILGGIVTGLPAVLLYAALTRRNDMLTDLYVFEALGYPQFVGIAAGALCIVAAIAYFVVIPTVVWPGQTPGKRFAHVRVATLDGSVPSLGRLVWRQVFVAFLLEGSGYVASRYIREILVLATRVDVNYYWEIAGMVVTAVSLVLFLVLRSRRCVHDFLAGTCVVPAEGHPLAG